MNQKSCQKWHTLHQELLTFSAEWWSQCVKIGKLYYVIYATHASYSYNMTHFVLKTTHLFCECTSTYNYT